MEHPLISEAFGDEPQGSYDANDPKVVNAANKKAARERAEELKIIGAILTHAGGRRWFYDLLNRCSCFSQSYVMGSFDATAFQEGRRSIGNKYLADAMEADNELFLLMVKESKKREKLAEIKARKPDDFAT